MQSPGVLGIRSRLCGGCSSEKTVDDRVFVEFGQLYCEECWLRWERCGRWGPTMRICTRPPKVGSSGLPEFGPEDAFSISELLCKHDDLSLLQRLQSELPQGKDLPPACLGLFSGKDMNFGSNWWTYFDDVSERWGPRHLGMQVEGSDVCKLRTSGPSTLRELVLKLEGVFGIETSAARLNLYHMVADFKQLHTDRGRDANGVPQVTVGLSLGASRELTFAHWQTGLTMTFPQHNGDVFAFTPELNRVFLHGVPRVSDAEGLRISLILWGSKKAP